MGYQVARAVAMAVYRATFRSTARAASPFHKAATFRSTARPVYWAVYPAVATETGGQTAHARAPRPH